MLLAMGTGLLAHAKDARSADNAYLDALQGECDMAGTFLGKAIRYGHWLDSFGAARA
jgi:hypothetical protein